MCFGLGPLTESRPSPLSNSQGFPSTVGALLRTTIFNFLRRALLLGGGGVIQILRRVPHYAQPPQCYILNPVLQQRTPEQQHKKISITTMIIACLGISIGIERSNNKKRYPVPSAFRKRGTSATNMSQDSMNAGMDLM